MSASRQRPLPPLRRILVPTDFSRGAVSAAHRIGHLPLARGVTITLLHVLPELRTAVAGVRHGAAAEEGLAGAAAELEAAFAEGGTGARPAIRALVEQGAIHQRIARAAAREQVDLIVMGRRGQGPFAGRPGSTAARVLRTGEVPILIVGPPPRTSYRKPIAAVDFSERSVEAVRAGCRLLPDGVDLTLVNAYLLPPIHTLRHAGFSRSEAARHERDMAHGAGQSARELLDELDGLPVARRPVLRHGEPGRVVLQEARRRGVDLIVVGSHGRSGLPYVLIGSVAEAIIDKARCDVLVARLTRPGRRPPRRAP